MTKTMYSPFDIIEDNKFLIKEIQIRCFSQITTKVPPLFDGRQSWFAYEEAIDDWTDVTELEGRNLVVTSSLDGLIKLWDVEDKICMCELKDPN